jgi:hypothetical protein
MQLVLQAPSKSAPTGTLSARAIPTRDETVGFVRPYSMSWTCFASSWAADATASWVSPRSSRSARTRFPRRMQTRRTSGEARISERHF